MEVQIRNIVTKIKAEKNKANITQINEGVDWLELFNVLKIPVGAIAVLAASGFAASQFFNQPKAAIAQQFQSPAQSTTVELSCDKDFTPNPELDELQEKAAVDSAEVLFCSNKPKPVLAQQVQQESSSADSTTTPDNNFQTTPGGCTKIAGTIDYNCPDPVHTDGTAPLPKEPPLVYPEMQIFDGSHREKIPPLRPPVPTSPSNNN